MGRDLGPGGLLSTLPAIGTCLLGVFAGLLLKDLQYRAATEIAVADGRRRCWRSSPATCGDCSSRSSRPVDFVLRSGDGRLSLLLLGAFYQVLDVWGCRRWTMLFVWIGANAITLYILNNLMDFQEVAARLVGGDMGVPRYPSLGGCRTLRLRRLVSRSR